MDFLQKSQSWKQDGHKMILKTMTRRSRLNKPTVQNETLTQEHESKNICTVSTFDFYL